MNGQQEGSCPEGQAAYKAIKSQFAKLVVAIMRESIPDKLYSEEILGDDTIDTLLNQSQTEKNKGRQFVRELQNAVQIKPKCFTTLCDVLAEDSLSKDLSRDLKCEKDHNVMSVAAVVGNLFHVCYGLGSISELSL